ncbi:MAG: hypothetical protein JWN86_965 [Planctomycetota bacterium]|nr:hypothetical protein [Planctomycetota bacterium]
MTFALGLLFLASSVLADDPPAASKASEEIQRLQGTWKFEALRTGDEEVKPEALGKRSLFFGADSFLVFDAGRIVQAGTLQVDPSKTPRTLNLVVKQGDHQGETLLGIYSFEGDLLKACVDLDGQSRPSEFKARAGSKTMFFSVRHPAWSADETIAIVGKYKSETEGAEGEKIDYDVAIERRGDAYLVTYTKLGQLVYIGTGLRTGNVLSMAWATQGQAGVSAYKIEKGPRLVGRYATLGGPGMTAIETMTPEKVRE